MTSPPNGPGAPSAAFGDPVEAAAAAVEHPPVADGVPHGLDPRSVTVNRIGAAVLLLPLAGGSLMGISGLLLTSPLPWWARAALALTWLAALTAIGWLMYRWPAVEHRHASYVVDEQGIEIRRGVFWRRVTTVPRSRVQHTDVAQGPLERRFGLGTLVIYTAGTDHAKVDLSGLDHGRALRIRDHLLPERGGDAV